MGGHYQFIELLIDVLLYVFSAEELYGSGRNVDVNWYTISTIFMNEEAIGILDGKRAVQSVQHFARSCFESHFSQSYCTDLSASQITMNSVLCSAFVNKLSTQ